MKKKRLMGLLAVEVVVCLIFAAVRLINGDGIRFGAVMAFPFEQIGLWLRFLSLSGDMGNIIAIIIYVSISLMPLILVLVTKKIRMGSLHWEDSLVGLLSILLFAVLYLMINPGLIVTPLGGGIEVAKAILGGTVYSVICAYVVLKVLRRFFDSGTELLQKYLAILLGLLSVVFVFAIFGIGLDGLIGAFETLRAGNVGNENLLGLSYIFLCLRFIVDSIPFGINILVVFSGIDLVSAISADRYSEETVSSAKKLSVVCKLSLMATVLSNASFNILQIMFARNLNVVNGSVEIPIISIVFVLAVLLLSRFAAENKALKDDNDSFI